MTMTIEVSDDVLKKLKELAQQTAVSPEEIAVEAINEHLSAQSSVWSSDSVRDAARQVIAEDGELLRRLAQ